MSQPVPPPAPPAHGPVPLPTPVWALRAQAPGEQALSGPALAFQRAWVRVERLRQQLDDMERIAHSHQTERVRLLLPQQTQVRAGQRRLVLALAGWLEGPDVGLSRAQQATARARLCAGAEALAQAGEPDMAALHDRHSPASLAQKAAARSEALRELFGTALDGAVAPEADGPDAVLQAAWAQLREQRAQTQARRSARRAARQAKRADRPAQAAAADAQQAAHGTLRTLYRRLASALHPDRATDEADRQRKNAWMSEANAAHERRDLVALLRLQWQAEGVDPQHPDRVPEARLQALTHLLQRQAADLERERQAAQQRWAHALDLPQGARLTAETLQAQLQAEAQALAHTLARLRQDLDQVEQRATLKAWLNAQRQGPPSLA